MTDALDQAITLDTTTFALDPDMRAKATRACARICQRVNGTPDDLRAVLSALGLLERTPPPKPKRRVLCRITVQDGHKLTLACGHQQSVARADRVGVSSVCAECSAA